MEPHEPTGIRDLGADGPTAPRAAAGGGVWETHDSGATWAPRTDDQVSPAMGSIGFSGAGGVVNAGTGDSTGIPDALGGMGLLRSLDGGATWRHVPGAPFEKGGVADVKANPVDP